ncbi:2-oxoacid:acceptor oxidoreductase family protein [Candidatus Pacearchaeota archaeon]|nr:2-oxoacid:acceptor oxidoreductase family protein [Candidatus Pacearchaeota archaeon]
MRCNIICGGPAGQGPNFLARIISQGLVKEGYFVFCSREYESRIRGGHNYNTITFSDKPINSNASEIDILVTLDNLSLEFHKTRLNKNSIVLKEEQENISFAGRVFKLLEIDFSILDNELKKYGNYKENIEEAKKGYAKETRKLSLRKPTSKNKNYFMSGSEAVALGACKSGMEFYYSYPMTPATAVLFELAQKESMFNYKTIELESEIASINAAVGSAITGAKAMVGTAGGGFDLMTETLSMIGMAEIPLVIYLAQRTGPGTGAATLTSQADLHAARHSGHGEFPRVVVAPGDPKEAIEKISELFYLTQKYRIAGILLSDKHLAESFYCFDERPKIITSKKSIRQGERFSSYMSDNQKSSTQEPKIIEKISEEKINKSKFLAKESDKFETFKIHGKKDSKNIIVGWGSTKGAILDAIAGLDCKFLQVLYIEPLSQKIKSELSKAKNIILVENNSTSQLSEVLAEKTGVIIEEKNKILKYDGYPFMSDILVSEIKKRLK